MWPLPVTCEKAADRTESSQYPHGATLVSHTGCPSPDVNQAIEVQGTEPGHCGQAELDRPKGQL